MGKYNAANIITGFLAGAVGAFVVLVLAANGFITANGRFPNWFAGQTPSNATATSSPIQLSPTPPPTAAQESFVIDAVKKANPSVVSIIISKDVPVIERFFEESPLDPFGDFFGPFSFPMPQFRQKGTEKRQIGGGSGFLVSSDGLIMTNRHVVSDANAEYTVFTNDGKKHDAKIIARDPVNDLAVIQIKGSAYPFLTFGDSDALLVGQSVIAIGNALAEFRNTVSVGVISGLSRSITAGDRQGQSELLEGVIQTDAAINPGNSGGPLLDLRGNVIGVNVAVAQGSENIGFALPGKLAQSVVESVRKTGRIVRPFLGVRYIQINERVKDENKLTVDYGALVVRGETPEKVAVIPGSPADKAGIVENDIILEVDGVKISDNRSLAGIIRLKKVGDRVNLKILHKGEEKTVSVVLEEIQP